ncbi:GntR family transcriptional regulator [Weizmannia acidilactici]|uniref:GntR family transcriptional regulator n=1 Tax=Weizmannia acidilactici TaxID=2607726 RepID=UPI00124D120C|nr:GntR family transcriptional regulator [Weizmannia acidilactici]GER73545.1 GntR family transcriptional regulator [Weizmannia acidilactici]
MNDPKYLKIIYDLKEEILSGKLKPGEKIYSEGELKKKYNVSNTTVVRALQELVRDGLINRIQGKGTFVSKSILNKQVIFNEYSHFPNDKKKQFNSIESLERTEVDLIKEIKDSHIAKKLNISSNEGIFQFQRIRYVDDVPWALQNNFIPKSYLNGIDLSNQDEFTSLSEKIFKVCGINILHEAMRETIEIEYPVRNEVREKLKINDSPVYHIQRITYLSENKPFEFVDTYVRHNYYSIEIIKEKY